MDSFQIVDFLNLPADDHLMYRATRAGDLQRLLVDIYENPGLASLIKEFVFDVQFDGAQASGVLDFGLDHGLQNPFGFKSSEEVEDDGGDMEVNLFPQLEGETDNMASTVSDSDDDTEMEDGTFSDNEGAMSESTESTASLPNGPLAQHPLDTTFEDLALIMRLSDMDTLIPSLQVYLDLLAAILSIFPNIKALYLPREWIERFNFEGLNKDAKVGVTEDIEVYA